MPEPSPEVVEALFQQAAELDPEMRGAFLSERCAGDPDLRAAVEELLHFDARAQARPISCAARPPMCVRHRR